jgi:hypothetical protein
MLPKIRFFFLGVLTLILFSALGITLGILAVLAWVRVESTGIFVKWQLLDSLHRFQHLMNANQAQVIAQAEDGKYYLYDSYYCGGTTGRKCDEWVEWPQDQELNTLRNTIVESECKATEDSSTNDLNYSNSAKPRYPPQKESAPRECVISLEYYPTGGETLTYYVLLENGKIWKWIHKSPAMQYLWHLILFALGGLVIGIIIWVRFLIFLSQIKSRRAASVSNQSG